MKVTAKIKLDLRSQNYGSSVYAVQGDGGSRCVEAALLDGGKPWNVPAGVTAAVAYKKPDFTKGLYDKLSDDTPAVTVSGSTVTVILAKQMLTVPGSVQACIVFNNAALDQLTTFPFTVAVAANPVIGAEPSDDYIRLQWLEDKLDEYVKKITEGIVPGGSGGAVSSVNGKTGAVVLTADDVHALPDNTVIPTVPEKVSAFENDAGYLTEHQDISGKVDKVAGKGLSTHDYDDAAKAKVDAIPEDPKYTDTEYDDTAVVESLNQLKVDLSDLAPAGAAVGQLFRVAAISEDGKYTMEPVDMPYGGAVDDVAVNGVSIVKDGVAHIPVSNTSVLGLVSLYSGYGITKYGNDLGIIRYTKTEQEKLYVYRSWTDMRPINIGCIDSAVKAAMCDGKGDVWTDTERIAALLRMGCTVDDNGFVRWGVSE